MHVRKGNYDSSIQRKSKYIQVYQENIAEFTYIQPHSISFKVTYVFYPLTFQICL